MFANVPTITTPMKRGASGLCALAALGMLVSCSGGSDDDASAAGSVETAAAPATTEVDDTTDTTDTTEAPAPTGSVSEDVLTEPGTELVVGDTAVVTIDTDLPDEHVALTVDAIRQGTTEELDQLRVEDLADTSAIWYVDYTVTNVSAAETDGDYTPTTVYQFGVLAADDSIFTPIIKFVAFDACENELVDDLAIGESVTTCQIFVSEDGQDADRVVYTPDLDTATISWR